MKNYIYVALVSVFLSGCGDSGSSKSYSVNVVSSDNVIQSAYETCLSQTAFELEADNPDTPKDIMKFMYDGAKQTCNSAVVTTCSKGIELDSCKVILNMYKG
ncbi:MAG: hypothetical protein V7745_02880 [Pseudomonadales bacterium]